MAQFTYTAVESYRQTKYTRTYYFDPILDVRIDRSLETVFYYPDRHSVSCPLVINGAVVGFESRWYGMDGMYACDLIIYGLNACYTTVFHAE